MAKRLELLRGAIPRMTRVAVLVNPDNPARGPDLQRMEIAARSWKVELQPFEVRGPNEFAGALSAIAKTRVDAIVIHQDGKLNASPRAIADLTTKYRLPSVGIKEFAAKAFGVTIPNPFLLRADQVIRLRAPAR
jgi:putative ABC transport system substrate-binding protein